ncbi:HNH endonuclease [Streptomyces sp. NPDC056943]|uniref:HNH endonuclease n=1 Tax=Streptomyces sp. NPDC056943 TaxID=3345971 RepID=UPI003631F1B8
MRSYGVLDATAAQVDPLDIYQRDHWACQLCHRAIDSAADWPDPWSAALDRIKPVSLAGEHTAGNLQASHWTCNILKGYTWGPGKAQPSTGEGQG